MPSLRPHLAVFRLVEVAEVETLVDGDPADIRIEVFEDAANPGQYRCRTWRLLEYGLHPPGFRDDDDGLATEWETVLVPWWVPGGFVTEDRGVVVISAGSVVKVKAQIVCGRFVSRRTERTAKSRRSGLILRRRETPIHRSRHRRTR